MADTNIVKQASLTAATPADLYTVPGATSATVSSICICNRGTAATFRVSIAVAGAVTANDQYLFYDTAVEANETYIATIGITLNATDKVRVYASTSNITAMLFGSERT